eukprot:COSAG02_NODE_3492_length_6657_cov_20.300091_7_plen_97_part_00
MNFGWNFLSLKFVVPRVIALGPRVAFERWSLVAAACFVLMGLSPMPVGRASLLRRSVQYIVPAMLVCHQWTEVSSFAMRAMVVKQAMAVCTYLTGN